MTTRGTPLQRVTCLACGWTSHTRHAHQAPHHKCPECKSPNLKIEQRTNG